MQYNPNHNSIRALSGSGTQDSFKGDMLCIDKNLFAIDVSAGKLKVPVVTNLSETISFLGFLVPLEVPLEFILRV